MLLQNLVIKVDEWKYKFIKRDKREGEKYFLIFPKNVEIVEVGPRDGLQNEQVFVPTNYKKTFINKLVQTGVRRIETSSFVNGVKVPQMADAEEIANYCNSLGVDYIALTPNEKALERAMNCKVPQIAIFIGASDTFNKKNINRRIEESLEECKRMIDKAKHQNIYVRAYVSTAFFCPYEGEVSFDQVNKIVSRYVQFGADEIAIGDTNGSANPRMVYERLVKLKELYPEQVFAVHFHDTNGFGLANVLSALQAGVTIFDSSIAGIGGCPFVIGATGNIATEKLVQMLYEMEIETNLNEKKLKEVSSFTRQMLKDLKKREYNAYRK